MLRRYLIPTLLPPTPGTPPGTASPPSPSGTSPPPQNSSGYRRIFSGGTAPGERRGHHSEGLAGEVDATEERRLDQTGVVLTLPAVRESWGRANLKSINHCSCELDRPSGQAGHSEPG